MRAIVPLCPDCIRSKLSSFPLSVILKLSIEPVHAEWVAQNYSVPFSLRIVEYDIMACLEMGEGLTFYSSIILRNSSKQKRSTYFAVTLSTFPDKLEPSAGVFLTSPQFRQIIPIVLSARRTFYLHRLFPRPLHPPRPLPRL